LKGEKHPLWRVLMGAQHSVELIVQEPTSFIVFHELSKLRNMLDHPHPRVVCRAVICSPTYSFQPLSPDEEADLAAGSRLFPSRWDVRVVRTRASTGAVIVDNREAMVIDSESVYQYTSDPILVTLFHDHFKRLWADDSYTLLHEDLLRQQLPGSAAKIAVLSQDFWNALIARLARDPKQLYLLDPRHFEELVAELLVRHGCDVHLTPRSKDGGCDIMARFQTPMGRLLYLVECKRWAASRPVGVQIVNALYGVVSKGQATGGMIVTTSRFTSGALEIQRALEHRLMLKDYNALVAWLGS
jgi:hypothetical protein